MNYIYKSDDENHIHTVKAYNNGVMGKFTNPKPLSNDQAQSILRDFKKRMRSNAYQSLVEPAPRSADKELEPYRGHQDEYVHNDDELILKPLPLVLIS